MNVNYFVGFVPFPLLASSEISKVVKVTGEPTVIEPRPQRSTILSVKVYV